MEEKNARPDGTPAPEHDNAENNNMASLLAEEGIGIDFPRQGEIRTGTIATISPTQILVSVGTKSEGVITGKELEYIPADELATLQVGQSIPVFIINPEDSNGNIVLSYVRAREEVDWNQADDLMNSRKSCPSKVIGYNKGGLIVPVGDLRGFIPASQFSLSRRAATSGETPDKRYSDMVGEEINVCVIEVDRERRRLILSERAASSETRESLKERVIDELKEGDLRTGRVTSLAEFGAFVNINGADGLVHLSEISWDRIQHPNEVLKVGQEVKVKVITIDREKRRIGLSIRATLQDPWMDMVSVYQVGQLVEGTITRLAKFGAFARLTDDVEGLIHISEISERRIEHPKEVLKEGDKVTLRIIKIDPDNHRIGLSLRRVESMAFAEMDWQTLLEESREPAEEPVVEPAAEQVVEAVVEPVVEPESKPKSKPKTKPVTKPVDEPVSEPAVEPVVEPESKPKRKPKTKPADEPVEAPESKAGEETPPTVE